MMRRLHKGLKERRGLRAGWDLHGEGRARLAYAAAVGCAWIVSGVPLASCGRTDVVLAGSADDVDDAGTTRGTTSGTAGGPYTTLPMVVPPVYPQPDPRPPTLPMPLPPPYPYPEPEPGPLLLDVGEPIPSPGACNNRGSEWSHCNKLDVLVVVDPSPSAAPLRESFQAGFRAWVAEWTSRLGVEDVRYALLADLGPRHAGHGPCSVPGATVWAADYPTSCEPGANPEGTFGTTPSLLTCLVRTIGDPTSNLAMGSFGTGLVHDALAALRPELNDACNGGFRRLDAPLLLIFIGLGVDGGKGSVEDWRTELVQSVGVDRNVAVTAWGAEHASEVAAFVSRFPFHVLAEPERVEPPPEGGVPFVWAGMSDDAEATCCAFVPPR